ncbi:hypothetical protein CQA53_06250 [Helicobacter didelphidarum]|uniref:Outer membrane protein beta-barrel domain-containing protein n=1 Tax=Helicobacter didelphidarum TaxID=2040648 RepID=A0A3D8IJG2_9HELI|nr:outer membrane beta-barrel protein [Helicobacter didelphidarum]RDU65372.1 hypothetical protein CQA53_06250 [Helicobacter didelphidarum]
MKLLKKICILAGIFVCSVIADELHQTETTQKSNNRFVIGVYGGGSYLSMSSDYEYFTTANSISFLQDIPGEYDSSIGGYSWGAKLGYDMYFLPRRGVRLYVDYMNSVLDSKEGTLGKMNLHTIGLNADYKFEIAGGFGVFAGLGLTYNIINTQYLGNDNRFGGSFNVGLAYQISIVEIELRFRYLLYDVNEKRSAYIPNAVQNIIPGVDKNNIWHYVDMDTPLSIHLGINLRF